MTGTKATYLGIIVKDIAAATAFYRDTLGLPVDEGESIPGAFTQFKLAGETTVALQAGTEAPNGQSFEPGLLVENIDAIYRQWQQQGSKSSVNPSTAPLGALSCFVHQRAMCCGPTSITKPRHNG